MANTNLSTNELKISYLNDLYNSVSNNNTQIYLYIGDFSTHTNTIVQNIYNNTQHTLTDVYKNMILGKKLTANNFLPVISYKPWQNNTFFAMYDDTDDDLDSKDFFCITEEGSNYYIWKCLYNNLNVNSTISPLYSDISSNPYDPYITNDGYQ